MIHTPKYPPRRLLIEKKDEVKVSLPQSMESISILEDKVQAQVDRSEFLEDCMAELAVQAYQ